MEVEQKQNEAVQEQKPNDKEYNFRALEAKYERIVAQQREEKENLLRQLEDFKKSQNHKEEDDDDSEPYVDTKRLYKTLDKFEKKVEDKIEKRSEERARRLLEEERKNAWLEATHDFYDVMQHAEKLAQKAPELAKVILKMPEGFERQQLVYNNIKAMGLDKPEVKQSNIQEKINANQKSPYYQPSGVGTAPYASSSDFSMTGQEQSYRKMQELKSRLRLG